MARLFGNYNKPGPGVGREAMGKYGFLQYFEIFFRKFWGLAQVNLMYLMIFIPVALLCSGLVQLVIHMGYGSNGIFMLLCFAPTILLAPANAGITKVTRDFGREEPGFIWQDFWESAKVNLKQSLVVSTIAYVGISVFILAMTFYHGVMTDSFFSMLPFSLSIVLCFLFVTMIFYLQLMVVTLDLKMKLLIKNAAILSVAVLGKNIVALFAAVLYAGLFALLFYYSLGSLGALVLLIAVSLMIIFSLIFYTINYVLFRVISKYIIEPYYKSNPDKTADGILNRGEIKDEDGSEYIEEEERELPEYVYENGKMVHRSVIEARSIFEDQGREEKK